jgi:hypothetical protein
VAQGVPFKCDTYRVLIASPSDLEEERRAATDAINDWNAQHAAAEAVVLLPVKWETHARPQSGIRPQEAINRQLVGSSDLLVGMFWTKLGTNTGVAESGTVEEVDQFVSAGKPALLYFSGRPIDPNKIDLTQQRKLRQFKATTYKNALVGGFASTAELRQMLLRDLTSQVRQTTLGRRAGRGDRLDQASKLAALMVNFRKNQITPDDLHKFKDELLRPRHRSSLQLNDPFQRGEVGPNGHRVGYTRNGDKVEWLPDEENPGEEFPMILRRNDKAILKAEQEFMDVIWYDRKLVLLQRLREGAETIDPDIEKGMLAAMRAAEKKIRQEENSELLQGRFWVGHPQRQTLGPPLGDG